MIKRGLKLLVHPVNLVVGKWPPIVLLLLLWYWWEPNDLLRDATPMLGIADDWFVAGITLAITRTK